MIFPRKTQLKTTWGATENRIYMLASTQATCPTSNFSQFYSSEDVEVGVVWGTSGLFDWFKYSALLGGVPCF